MTYAIFCGSMPKAVLQKLECYYVGIHLTLGGASISPDHGKCSGNWFS